MTKRFFGKHPTLKRVSELLRYDPSTGNFYRRNPDGSETLRRYSGPYVRISIDNVQYYGHVLAWFIIVKVWPRHEIDHKDLDKKNNAWDNLRQASSSQNKHNSLPRKIKKTSKYKGVSWVKDSKKWTAHICVDYHQKYLGLFTSEEDAHVAYSEAAKKYCGEFARI